MRLLFVHQNFPGQFKHLAAHFASLDYCETAALCINKPQVDPGFRVLRYAPNAKQARDAYDLALNFQTKTIRGIAAAEAADQLRREGFKPDLIYAHPGWGEAMFLREVFPHARLLSFAEFFYHSRGSDSDFDPEFQDPDLIERCRVRSKNPHLLAALQEADWNISPTRFQRDQIPEVFHNRISVVHDGIDTEAVRPDPMASLELQKAGIRLEVSDEVVTFVNRTLEPSRGYHIFMRALPEILRRRPRAHAVLVGGDDGGYHAKPKDGQTWRSIFLKEVVDQLDMSRVHFVGRITYGNFLRVLQVSAAHVYFTYPFVLSWSMLEAMAAECLIIGSRTPPVEEVIRDGENGILVDFFDPRALSEAVVHALTHPLEVKPLRRAARRTIVQNYDLNTVCLPRQIAIMENMANRLEPYDPLWER